MDTPHFTLTITASTVAWYAAIVATVGACIQFANFLRDRVNVKIRFQRDMEIIGDPRRQGIVFTLLEIVNSGRRPVTITNVTLTYLGGGGAVATDIDPRPPFELTEGKMARAFLDESSLRFSDIKAFHAHDAVGRTYTVGFAPWYKRIYWLLRRTIVGKKPIPRAMRDEWTKNLGDGRIAIYTMNIGDGTGGVITAKVGDIIQTRAVEGPMTREQVEAEFGNL